MSREIFINADLQKQFARDGYVKVPLLSDEDIHQLRSLYTEYHPEEPKGFISSTYSDNYEFKKSVSEKTTAIISPRLDEILKDHRPIGASFLAKAKGKYGEMPMHQDWTIVDEDQFVAVNVWTPLVDCTEENGTLEVLQGSHRFLNVLRMPTLDFVLDGKQYDLLPFLTPVPTKAGEAVILNQALVHYSKPNQTEEVRTAITTGVVSKNAALMLYYFDSNHEDRVEKFSQSEDFLLRFDDFMNDIYSVPKMGESKGYLAFRKPSLSWDAVLAGIREAHGGQLPSDQTLDIRERTGLLRKLISKMFG